MFDELLEQDEFVKRQYERGFQEGKAKGRLEGRIEAFQLMLVDIVKQRFPSLEDLAQQRAAQMRQVDALREIIKLVNVINDENIVRAILHPSVTQ